MFTSHSVRQRLILRLPKLGICTCWKDPCRLRNYAIWLLAVTLFRNPLIGRVGCPLNDMSANQSAVSASGSVRTDHPVRRGTRRGPDRPRLVHIAVPVRSNGGAHHGARPLQSH